jgi:hypothetical protein
LRLSAGFDIFDRIMSALYARCVAVGFAVANAGLILGCSDPQEPPRDVILSPAECEARGGEVVGDPGDGSTHRDGCPNGRLKLGTVPIGIEGGICCKR